MKMNNDLINLYKEITGKETATDVKGKIENRLHEKMRANFIELIGIGSVLGYDKLYEEMVEAVSTIEKLKKQ